MNFLFRFYVATRIGSVVGTGIGKVLGTAIGLVLFPITFVVTLLFIFASNQIDKLRGA